MKYKKALEIAEIIHFNLYGSPKDHIEWAMAFNIKHKIAKILIKNV